MAVLSDCVTASLSDLESPAHCLSVSEAKLEIELPVAAAVTVTKSQWLSFLFETKLPVTVTATGASSCTAAQCSAYIRTRAARTAI